MNEKILKGWFSIGLNRDLLKENGGVLSWLARSSRSQKRRTATMALVPGSSRAPLGPMEGEACKGRKSSLRVAEGHCLSGWIRSESEKSIHTPIRI